MNKPSIEDIEDFYILGLPIKTEVGNCHFLKVKEYPIYAMSLQITALSRDGIIHKYSEINKDGSLDNLIKELRKHSLFDLVYGIPEITEAYAFLFDKVFDKSNVLAEITDKN